MVVLLSAPMTIRGSVASYSGTAGPRGLQRYDHPERHRDRLARRHPSVRWPENRMSQRCKFSRGSSCVTFIEEAKTNGKRLIDW